MKGNQSLCLFLLQTGKRLNMSLASSILVASPLPVFVTVLVSSPPLCFPILRIKRASNKQSAEK